jgi:hypothetical protein
MVKYTNPELTDMVLIYGELYQILMQPGVCTYVGT